MELGWKMWQQFNFFNWGFLAKTLTIHKTTEERNEPYLFPFTISTRSRTLSHLQFSIWNYYLLFSIATHVITRLLLDQSRDVELKDKCFKYISSFRDQIYPPLRIRTWLNINFILHVDFMSDFIWVIFCKTVPESNS